MCGVIAGEPAGDPSRRMKMRRIKTTLRIFAIMLAIGIVAGCAARSGPAESRAGAAQSSTATANSPAPPPQRATPLAHSRTSPAQPPPTAAAQPPAGGALYVVAGIVDAAPGCPGP